MFTIKINGGTLKHGNYFIQLSNQVKKDIQAITSYNELYTIYESLDEYHKKMVIHEKFSMRDDMDIYSNLKSNKTMNLINTIKRGCFTTLSFKI